MNNGTKWKECIFILDITTILFILRSDLDQGKPTMLISQIVSYVMMCCIQICLMRAANESPRLVLILFCFKLIPIWLSQNSFQMIFYISNLIEMNITCQEGINLRDNYLYLIFLSVLNISSKLFENGSWSQEMSLQIIQSVLCLFICLQHQQNKKNNLPLLVEQNFDKSHLIKSEQKDNNRVSLKQLDNQLAQDNYLILDKNLGIKRLSLDLHQYSTSIQSESELLQSFLHDKIKGSQIDLQFGSLFDNQIRGTSLVELLQNLIECENTQLELNCILDSSRFNSIFTITVQLCQEHYELIVLINIQSIVKRKQNLEEVFQLLMKSLSHEFGTNLNCINSLANAHLETIDVTSSLRDNLLIPIIQNCEIMNIISQNLSDFEHLQNSTIKLTVEKFNLLDELQLIISLYSESCKVKQIQLEIECNLDDEIYTDKQRLRQVFLQIFSNSVRFTRRGWIKIKAQVSSEKIEIQVSDSGIGMNEDEQAKLHYLLDEGYLQKISVNSIGAGLGLHISNQIVMKMNKCGGDQALESTIEFTSQEGKGSEFKFRILNCNIFILPEFLSQHQRSSIRMPRMDSYIDEESRVISHGFFEFYTMQSSSFRVAVHKNMSHLNTLELKFQSQSQSQSIINCCSKILIIDDEYFNLFAMTKLLSKFTKHVDIAFNGQEALDIVKLKQECQICKSKCFKIFFIDINMPIMNGIQTVKILKQMMKNNEISEGVCIANSAFSDVETKDAAYVAGMDYYIVKPINTQKLELLMLELLNK